MATYAVRRNTKYNGKFLAAGTKVKINELDDMAKLNINARVFQLIEEKPKKGKRAK
jgi:hypothetical protein